LPFAIKSIMAAALIRVGAEIRSFGEAQMKRRRERNKTNREARCFFSEIAQLLRICASTEEEEMRRKQSDCGATVLCCCQGGQMKKKVADTF
jgi:hypothetical protein